MRSRAHILEFKGITLEDLKNVSLDIDQDIMPKFYSDAPVTWTVGEELCTSDLKCWNCNMSFNGKAAFIPVSPKKVKDELNENAQLLCFDRYGNYCSWPCAARDAYYRFGALKNYSDIQQSLRVAFNSITRLNVPYVRMSPDKTTMAEYCGNGGMTDAEYTHAIKKIVLKMKED